MFDDIIWLSYSENCLDSMMSFVIKKKNKKTSVECYLC